VLEDLGSANGTRLNGARVARPTPVFDGDVIEIGSVRLRYSSGAVEQRPTVVRTADDPEVAAAIDPERADPATEGAGEAAVRRLRLVCDGAQACADAGDPSQVPATLLGLVVEALRPDRAAVALLGPDGALRAAAAHPPGSPVPESRTLRRRVLEGGEAVLVRDARTDGDRGELASFVRSRFRSTLAAPLRTSEGTLGLVTVESESPDRWGTDDLQALAAATRQAALALRTLRALGAARAEVVRLTQAVEEGAPPILGTTPAVEALRAQVAKAAATDVPVLVLGETGTGKELVARRLHVEGPRRREPFVALNSAALVEGLLESELFGHEKGAFTGAVERREGRIAEAGRGTLFLDEVGDLPAGLQAKLLRVLSERTYTRVGGRDVLRMECRLVAATNRDLAARVASGAFREDLYYRLAVLVLAVPPLRERAADVETLAEAGLERIAARLGRRVPRLSDDARAALRAHRWPGNVRELLNVLERAVVLLDGDTVHAADLPREVREVGPGAPPPGGAPGVVTMREAEKRAVQAALAATGGRKGAAAALLGISWPTLNRKIREYGIPEGE
jgi:DNA-binding NtrC family response regulator